MLVDQTWQCAQNLSAGQPTPACKIPGSGWACGVDFERWEGNGTTNYINKYLIRYWTGSIAT